MVRIEKEYSWVDRDNSIEPDADAAWGRLWEEAKAEAEQSLEDGGLTVDVFQLNGERRMRLTWRRDFGSVMERVVEE